MGQPKILLEARKKSCCQLLRRLSFITQGNDMIKWYKNLYVGDNAKKKEHKIRRKIENKKLVCGVYLITYASNPENQLEIFPASQLKQETVYKRCPEIIGIASGYQEAIDMIVMLADKAYRQEGCGSIRSYLEQQK